MVELDTLLQMQFEALAELLRDKAVAVRVVAVQGVCRCASEPSCPSAAPLTGHSS